MKVLDKLNNSTNNSNAVEVWKPIKGYEGYYEVSSLGRVRSIARTITKSNGVKLKVEEKLLTQATITGGYLAVCLSKNGKWHCYPAHRLVAQTFIPNPDKLPIINHKDINPENNEVNNLEWCSYEYNNNYLDRNERMSMHKKKEIEVINSKGEIVDIVKGLIDTMDKYNISKHYIKQSNNGRDLIKAGVSRYNFKIAA